MNNTGLSFYKMAGIYIHIPFCKQACHYCNFHFSTSLKYKGEMVKAILQELDWRRDYLGGEKVESIYFGGGTPSLLDISELGLFVKKIYGCFPVASSLEVTLEANPDDLNLLKIRELKTTSVNRLSIGIQSFFDRDLQFMNRAHNAAEAISCLGNARSAGFENLTVDLIYGLPGSSDEQWVANLEQVFKFSVPHLSCYSLTVEPKTALDHFIKTGKTPAPNEEQAARQFEILMQKTAISGYEHYEISNFAKPGWYARHNSSYWQGKKYLGVGPSAHSFDGESRQWNIANNAVYLRAIHDGKVPFEKEVLSPAQCYNEYVMTSLRTSWGCNVEKIKTWNNGEFELSFLKNIEPHLASGAVVRKENVFYLTNKGKLLADNITLDLFIDA
jgi:oxygen-independent coproporphyrinogen-3 oxidase